MEMNNDIMSLFNSLPADAQQSVYEEIENKLTATKDKVYGFLQKEGIAHFDPTYDKTFKWLMSKECADGGIARTIFNSMIFLTYKGLAEREVSEFDSTSGEFDKMTEQLKRMPESQFQALMMDIPALLHLSQWRRIDQSEQGHESDKIIANIDEVREILTSKSQNEEEEGVLKLEQSEREKLINTLEQAKTQIKVLEDKDVQTTAEAINQRQSYSIMIDIEMQRSKQEKIELRTLQYGAVMLLSKSAEELSPMLLISICQWNEKKGVVVKDVSHTIVGEGDMKRPFSQETIYIQQSVSPIETFAGDRKSKRKQIKKVFKNALRERYPELTQSIRSFKELWNDESDLGKKRQQLRTAYEVLCFLRLAPLTPQLGNDRNDRKPNWQKIKDQCKGKRERTKLGTIFKTRVFNPQIRRAYNLMSINNMTNPHVHEQYRGVWELTEVNEAKAQLEEQVSAQTEDIKNNALSALNMLLRFAPDDKKVEAATTWAKETLSGKKNEGMRGLIFNELAKRQSKEAYKLDGKIFKAIEGAYNERENATPLRQSQNRNR